MMELDQTVFQFLYNSAENTPFVGGFFIFLAGYLTYILVAWFIFSLFHREKNKKRRFSIFSLATIAVIISRGILTPIIQFLVARPRPFVLLDLEPFLDITIKPSFPSGHIAFLAPLAFVLWLLSKRTSVWFFCGTLLVGIARVGIGAHWPMDILGGILVGFVSFIITYYLFRDRKLLGNTSMVNAEEETLNI